MPTEMLVINASPHGAAARSVRMVDGLLAGTGMDVRMEHLADSCRAGVSADYAKAVLNPSCDATGVLDRSEAFIRDIERADGLLILTPVHNLTVPATLKGWIDHVVRRDRSFRSTPAGKVGLLRDRPTMVVVTSGGFHLGPRMNQTDFLTPYLIEILATIGLRAPEFVHLQGTIMDAAAAADAERDVKARLADWMASLPNRPSGG